MPHFTVEGPADKHDYTLHATIKKVTEDVGGRFNFNTAISSIMELVNKSISIKKWKILIQAY